MLFLGSSGQHFTLTFDCSHNSFTPFSTNRMSVLGTVKASFASQDKIEINKVNCYFFTSQFGLFLAIFLAKVRIGRYKLEKIEIWVYISKFYYQKLRNTKHDWNIISVLDLWEKKTKFWVYIQSWNFFFSELWVCLLQFWLAVKKM